MEGAAISEGVLKKKGSTGCLIIKSKGTNFNDRRRPRLVPPNSSSSDEEVSLEFMRRKMNENRMNNGSDGYRKNRAATREHDRSSVRIGGCGETKSRLDLFEFDEYDEFDGKKMSHKFSCCVSKRARNSGSSILKDSNDGSSNWDLGAHELRKGLCFSGSSGGKEFRDSAEKSKDSEEEDDYTDMPISLLRLKYQRIAHEPIRSQGKNGVLKVMVDKKKKVVIPLQSTNSYSKDDKAKNSSRNDGAAHNDSLALEVNHPVPKEPQNQVNEEGNGKGRRVTNLGKEKPCPDKVTMESYSKCTGTMSKLSSCVQPSSSKKEMTKGDARSSVHEKLTPAKRVGLEGKTKQGGSTEKKKLRDQIQRMLVDAGWSIDYRPRRNRDYLDAVYINPSGTAYWSIIKAYDALKKQLEEDSSEIQPEVNTATIAPALLSDELINKLTRQTRKKIADEKNRKTKKGNIIRNGKKSALGDESSETDQDEEQPSTCKVENSPKSKTGKVGSTCDADQDDHAIRIKSCNGAVEGPLKASSSIFLHERTSKFIGRCTLMVRGSDKEKILDSDRCVPYNGKRTVLAWLIDSGTAKLSEKVQYLNRRKTRVMLEGWITREGIHCGCCSKILTVSKFELHAGSKLRQPFQNIFLESGTSLLQCQLDAWNSQDESLRQDFHFVDADGDDPDDDTCSTCGDGGDLICCDSCPSTFHQICLGIQMLPSGDWHCPNCACKFCGHYQNCNDAEEKYIATCKLKKCIFCEQKYHKTCSERVHVPPPSLFDGSFCGKKCQELHDHLKKILCIKKELEEGFTWSIIQRQDLSDSSHHGFPLRVENNSKLAVVLSVMNECFLPIFDRRSGINMIHSVVYNCGSNFNRLNYRGFYMVILERGDEIISAASIRLHGDHIAEMPFIGTREIYRRQGMCRRLLSAIESELCSLKVRRLIIPAVPEHINTWTKVFGFCELEDADKKEVKFLNMLVFPGTDMLQKQLLNRDFYDEILIPDSFADLCTKIDHASILKQSRPESITSGALDSYEVHISMSKFNTDALDSESPAPDISLNHRENVRDAKLNSVSAHISEGKNEGKPELENKGKKSLFSTKTSNGFDLKNQLTNAYPVSAVIDDVIMADVCLAPNLDFGGHLNANKACELPDASTIERGVNVDEKPFFSDTHSDEVSAVTSIENNFLEISAQKTEDRVNEEFIPTFCSNTVICDEPCEQLSSGQVASVSESLGHSSTDINCGANADGAFMFSPEKCTDDEIFDGRASYSMSNFKLLDSSATAVAASGANGGNQSRQPIFVAPSEINEAVLEEIFVVTDASKAS